MENKAMSSSNVLMLTDLSEATDVALKAAMDQAKQLNAFVTLMHVKSPAKVVSVENQLSAKRCIYDDYRTTIKKMQSLVNEDEINLSLGFEVAYGNLKMSVEEKVKELKPEFIFVGKRNRKLFFEKDGFTKWLNKKYDNVFVVSNLESANSEHRNNKLEKVSNNN